MGLGEAEVFSSRENKKFCPGAEQRGRKPYHI
jgi:hypothetical protein